MAIEKDKIVNLGDAQLLYDDLRSRVEDLKEGKQGSDLIVTFTATVVSGETIYSTDKTFAQIKAADDAGKNVFATLVYDDGQYFDKALYIMHAINLGPSVGSAHFVRIEDEGGLESFIVTNDDNIYYLHTDPVRSYAIAPSYSDLTFPVSAGTLCMYQGGLCKAKQVISTQEEFDATHWDDVSVSDELKKIDNQVIVSGTQPTETSNKLWVKTDPQNEYSIPTYAEFQTLSTALNSTTAMLADAESSSTAAHAHAVKTVFIYDGKLYMATSAIAVGDTIVTSGTGQNVTQVTLADAFPHDVQIEGTSVVQDGVANIPYATHLRFGVLKTNSNYGTGTILSSNGLGTVYVSQASVDNINSGDEKYKPISPYRQHRAVFFGLSKVAGEDLANDTVTLGEYPEKSKSAISNMLNAPESVTGSTPSITAKSGVRYVCGEVSTLTIVVPETGIVDVIFKSGSTPTVLTVTPPTGVTMSWIGDDPTALEANKTYEVNIMDGTYGMVVSWT